MERIDNGDVPQSCPSFIPLIVRAADDTIEPDDRARLDAHLAGCPACRAALEAQRMVHMNLAGAFDAEVPLGFATRIVAQLDPRESWLDRLDFRRWTWRLGPVAAGLAIAAYVVVASEAATSAESTVPETAVLLSDAVDESGIVALTWAAEVGASDADAAASTEETPQ